MNSPARIHSSTHVHFFAVALLFGAFATLVPAKEAEKTIGPLSPREEQATFQVAKGFTVQLVAAEPEVVDPVAMTFDEDGRMFVVEMRGYPNGGIGEGVPVLPGRVKLLEDRDGDGYYETSSVYMDNLRFPTGVTCWRGGIIVADAPDLLYCKDGQRKVLYTGFGAKNIQQMVNSLQFHFDNWVHGCNGSNDSVIRSVEKPDLPPVDLRGRNFRFKPDLPGSLEPMSGGGQYGLASDDWGNWFTCTNSQHIRHIVLPDHYLKRNPYLAVPAVTHDIADGLDEHTAAAKLFRISPFEPWRLERTTRRAQSADAGRYPSTELVPGGYVTSACGLTIYRGGAYPKEYDGNAYVCDPANNLIHRDVLVPDGPTFVAKRHDKDCEFLASTDTWFRPVFLCQGPDGAIYMCDFYREVIETPLSLPEDIQKRYNLQSGGRGRIWRIVAERAARLKKPQLGKAQNWDLASLLSDRNCWNRLTAQRLLTERQNHDSKSMEELHTLLRLYALERLRCSVGKTVAELTQDQKKGVELLWALDGYSDAIEKFVTSSMTVQGEYRFVIQLLKRIEPYLDEKVELQKLVFELVEHKSPMVRLQLAMSLGCITKNPAVSGALAKLACKDAANPWHEPAILSSALPHASVMLEELLQSNDVAPSFLRKLAGMVGTTGHEAAIRQALVALTSDDGKPTLGRMQVLEGLAQGLARKGQHVTMWHLEEKQLSDRVASFFVRTAAVAENETESSADRLAAIRLLAYVPIATSGRALAKLLTPQSPGELQVAAVRALSATSEIQAADVLLESWSSYSPGTRREVQEALFARAERLPRLLSAIEKGQVQASQIDPARREQLLKHANKDLRFRAQQVFAGQLLPERRQVVEERRKSLDLVGDADRGKLVFKNNCTTCHRLENEGHEVGPDLLSALKTKTKETLLVDILDPSREVDPRYLNYVVAAKDGRNFSGLIASETTSSLTLRRADRAEDTLLRVDIEAIQSTGKSLMPEGLEKQMTDQQLADVIVYLLTVARK